jgi:DNA-directed RNA polymerase specialized sigma24 family protein
MSEPNDVGDDPEFAGFLQLVRAGNAQAAEDLVRRYESIIRREVRLKLHDPSLHRILESVDICQSVMASFFVRAAAGQYDINHPLQLLRLLITMARNKVAMAARRQRAQRRDNRRVGALGVEEVDPAGGVGTPSRVVAAREMLDMVRGHLGDDERRLADLRGQGQEWSDIAAEMGGTADGRRMQLTRALDRVIKELRLEDQ